MAVAMQTRSAPADVASQMQTYFSRRLLDVEKEELVMDQFSAKYADTLQSKQGADTIRFFKRRRAYRGDVVTLTEGSPQRTATTQVESGYVDCKVYQRGEVATQSDVKTAIDIFNWLEQNSQTLGEDGALDADSITRNQIIFGMKSSNNQFELFAGLPAPTSLAGNTSADRWAELKNLASANSKITRARALAAVTVLKRNKVPMINGGYVGVISPEIMHDIRQDKDWVAAATQVNTQALYKRHAIALDGVTYVETTNPWSETVAYAPIASALTALEDEATVDTVTFENNIYSVLFLGRDAYGCPKLSGMGDPWAPKVVINDKADKYDPLNQYVALGWKAMWNAVLLKTNLEVTRDDVVVQSDIPHCVLLRCKTTFTGAA